jgi:histidinol-phosphate aminotransferase
VSSILDLVRDELRPLEAYSIPKIEGVRAKLDANESPWPLPADVAAELGGVLARVPLNRYPDGHADELRAVVARELGVPPAQLCFGNGSDELISVLIATFSRPRPGQGARARIAYPVPSFVVYRIATLANGAAPLEVPLRPDFTLDEDRLARDLAAGRPNIVFFALPNNPTGTLWPREAIVKVVERHPDTLVVADEAYFDYAGQTLLDLVPRHPNLVVMRTLSKLGLAGLRVGFMVASEQVIHEAEKARPVYNLGSLNQAAAIWLLERHRDLLRARVADVIAERERLAVEIAALGDVEVFPSQANFLLVRFKGPGRATAVWKKLAEAGVLVRNFDRPGPLLGCLRINVGTPDENQLLLEGLRA